jgi:hypothetical protein
MRNGKYNERLFNPCFLVKPFPQSLARPLDIDSIHFNHHAPCHFARTASDDDRLPLDDTYIPSSQCGPALLSDQCRRIIRMLTPDCLPEGQASLPTADGDKIEKRSCIRESTGLQMNGQESRVNPFLKCRTWCAEAGPGWRDQPANSKGGYLIVAGQRRAETVDLQGQ